MKKAISFVLVAVLILLGLAKPNVVSAQTDKITGSDQFTWSHYGNSEQCVPLYLNEAGTPVEVWVATEWHCVCHWKYNAEWDYFDQTWMLMRWRGSFTYEGVEYKINDQVTYGKNGAMDWNDPAYYAVKFVSNVKGSKGSHLVASGVFTMYDADWNWEGTFDYDKIVSQ
jgi:hypothetical protein